MHVVHFITGVTNGVAYRLGQYFVALYEGGDSKRFSLPVSVTANIQGDTWTATVEVPTSYLPPMVR